MADSFGEMLEAIKGVDTIDELANLVVLGKVFKRYITDNEPGYDSPPYLAVQPSHMTLDGKVAITPAEHEVLGRILKE